MYYSKGTQNVLTIPQNYSGNTFRVIDESDRTYKPEFEPSQAESNREPTPETPPTEEEKSESHSPISSLLSSISMEDLLLLGLIFVIHQHDPNDSTLILLLILLLAK